LVSEWLLQSSEIMLLEPQKRAYTFTRHKGPRSASDRGLFSGGAKAHAADFEKRAFAVLAESECGARPVADNLFENIGL
jgi:hypothetical protein